MKLVVVLAVLGVQAALASRASLRHQANGTSCASEDVKVRAFLQNKLAKECDKMCKEVGAYPKCKCPDFVEPDSTPGVMTWDELLEYMDKLVGWSGDTIKGWKAVASNLQLDFAARPRRA